MNNVVFVVDGEGKAGGLDLYWDEPIKINILTYRLHHIDSLIWDGEHHATWRGTFVYGDPRAQDRGDMWELIRRIKPSQSAP
jgi:hypothetical protein